MSSKFSAWLLTLMTAVAVSGCGGGGGGGSDAATDESLEAERLRRASGYALNLTMTGTGTVASSPSGVSCSATCSNTLTRGATYTLTATPAAGYTFTGWGGACSGTSTCSVTMSSAQSVTATFTSSTAPINQVVTAPPSSNLTLNVTIAGTGSVVSSGAISCSSGTCSASVASNTPLTLTATPSTGWKFSAWSGGCSGSSASCSVPMSQATSVTATFVVDTASAGCNITRSSVTGSYTVASSHPKVLFNHAQTLSCLQGMAAANTQEYKRLKSIVDSEVAGGVNTKTNYNFTNWLPAMFYKITGNTTYRDFAIARVNKLVTENMTEINAGRVPGVAYDSFLYVGEVMSDVALVYDWAFDGLTSTQKTQWIDFMNQTLHNVWNPNSASWGGVAWSWSGWATDDPFNNYHYSFMEATALVGLATSGENAKASTWLTMFRNTKLANSLVPRFNAQLGGGGSIEGTNYGVSLKRLFRLYDWWERSTGERIADLTPQTRNSLNWMVHQVTPDTKFLVSHGDQSRDHSAPFFDYNREYLLAAMSLYPQDRLSAAANLMLQGSSLPAMSLSFQAVWDFLYKAPTLPSANLTDLSTAWYGVGTGGLFMRSAWADPTATFAAVQCGEQFQSHQHYEQGSFQIYRGEWLAPSGNRFSRSGLQSGVQSKNNAHFVNGSTAVQQVGTDWITGNCNMAALSHSNDYTYASMKMTPVYNGHPSVAKHEREFIFIRPSTFVVFDRVVAKSTSTKRVWALNLPKAASVNGDRLTFVGDKSNRMDVHRVAPSGLSFQETPFEFSSTDLDTNCCTAAKHYEVVDSSANTATYFLHVIGTGGNATSSSVTSTTASPATGMTGTQITLTDGRVVTVRFNNTTTGGTIEIRNASGTVTRSESLATTVTTPSDFAN